MHADDRVERVCVMDSWFSGAACVKAVWRHHKVRCIGNVKTNARGFPVQEMRWNLATKERGQTTLLLCPDEKIYGLGWHDHHYKTFICNAGTNMPGTTAKKKRQRDDGSNYYKECARPEAMELYYAGCGKIDQHNRFRQYILGLEKKWRTQRWQTRMLHSMFVGMNTLDAFLVTQALLPDRGLEDADGSMDTFVTKLVAQMLPPAPLLEPSVSTPGSSSSSSSSSTTVGPPSASNETERQLCKLTRIGQATIQSGAQAGKKRPLDQRCTMCQRAGRTENETSNRAPKTTWMCSVCPDTCTCNVKNRNCLGEHRQDRELEVITGQ